jgi:arabinogalactan oligomer/maltooligosaccharide transport system permease protein
MNPLVVSLAEVVQMVCFVGWGVLLFELYLYIHFNKFDEKWYFPAVLIGVPVSALVFAITAEGADLPGGVIGAILAYAFVFELFAAPFFKYIVRGKHSLAYMMIAPGFVGLALLIAYPLVFEFYLSFHDLKLTTLKMWAETGTLPFVGFKQFKAVFTLPPLSEVTFLQLLGRTLWWTFINVFFHVVGGFCLALLLNQNIGKMRGIYRTLLVIPWAMPQVVAVLAMRGEFHSEYGFINVMIIRLVAKFPFLAHLGIGPVQWLSNHALLTCTLINVWLGIPFMMVIILGGLQSIPSSYYDAAAIDGASAFQRFWNITLPLMKPVVAPAVTLGTVWTFNNINVIYLVTGQAGGTEQADILVSALYKAAFTFSRYSYSAALAVVIFALLFVISVGWLKFTKGSESAYG